MEGDPARRFSGRVDHYARYRPSYPRAAVDLLARECGLARSSVVADVGSGTGIFSELLLERGCTVLGVEPNEEMRSAAERALARYPAFHPILRGVRPCNRCGNRGGGVRRGSLKSEKSFQNYIDPEQ